MVEALDEIPAGRRTPRDRLGMGPPGRLLWIVVAAAILIALDANSRGSFAELLLAIAMWLAVAGLWLLRFGWWAWVDGRRASIRAWLAWALVPALMGLVFVLTRFHVPFDVRLALSRGAMDQAAVEVVGGGSTDRHWIGWYPVNGVERTPNGMRFVVSDDLLGRWGFAWATGGQPIAPEDSEDSGLWCCDQYEEVGSGWWLWSQEWD
jgi:hypothetical protein